jgi:hypothetical protein
LKRTFDKYFSQGEDIFFKKEDSDPKSRTVLPKNGQVATLFVKLFENYFIFFKFIRFAPFEIQNVEIEIKKVFLSSL